MQPNNVQSVLALGDNCQYALLQIGISFAENGLNVWFIAPEAFDRAPGNMKAPDKEVLQLITFMYLKDYNDLITHLNGIHLWRKIPNVIIVTGFEIYCSLGSSDYNPLQAALVATSLLDSAAVCATKKSEKIFLLVNCAEPAQNQKEQLQTLKDLYFSNYVHKTQEDTFSEHILTLFK